MELVWTLSLKWVLNTAHVDMKGLRDTMSMKLRELSSFKYNLMPATSVCQALVPDFGNRCVVALLLISHSCISFCPPQLFQNSKIGSLWQVFLTLFYYFYPFQSFYLSSIGPFINYVTRTSWFFYPSPLVTGGHISETPPPSMTSHILQFYS